MDIREVYEILVEKCNKLGTNSGQLIKYHTAIRAINEAQTYWYDMRLKKAEIDTTVQRELQSLLQSADLASTEITSIFNTYQLPDDYYHPNQIIVTATKEDCHLIMDTFLTENFNSIEYYLNDAFSPDFEWQQTLATIKGNNLVVYKKDFSLSVSIDYFKALNNVDIASDYVHLDGSTSVNKDLQFDGSNAYEIITIAAMLITGSSTDPTYQVHMNNLKEFN